jgi:hypothetical protein
MISFPRKWALKIGFLTWALMGAPSRVGLSIAHLVLKSNKKFTKNILRYSLDYADSVDT